MFLLMVFKQMILFHIPFQYNDLLLHERDYAGFSALSEKPDCVRLAFNLQRFWCQIYHFLYPSACIVHKSQKSKVSEAVSGRTIRLLQQQFYPFCRKISDAFLFILDGLYRVYFLPFIQMVYIFILKVRDKGVYGCQPLVARSYSAASFFLNPGKKINYPVSGKDIQSESFYLNVLYIFHIVDKLHKSIAIRGYCIWTHVSFIGKVFRQELTEVFGKVSTCVHVLSAYIIGYTNALMGEHWLISSGYISPVSLTYCSVEDRDLCPKQADIIGRLL